MKKLLLLCIVLISLLSCETEEDCSTVICIGRPQLNLILVETETDETISAEYSGTIPEGLVLMEGDQELFFGQNYTFEDGTIIIFRFPDELRVSIESEFETTITAAVTEYSTGGCCPSYDVTNIEVSNGEFLISSAAPMTIRISI